MHRGQSRKAKRSVMDMSIRYLLFQIRRPKDPMRANEIASFTRALGCPPDQITAIDLINAPPSPSMLAAHDMVLIGGAGDYSVTEGGPWLEKALDVMRNLHTLRKPTFASCWGFQALAKALGGAVVADPARAEIGTLTLQLTEAGLQNSVFSELGTTFYAHVGHMDTVDALPSDAIQLACSPLVDNHAFRIRGMPIYATQFHPELRIQEVKARISSYPRYAEEIAGVPADTLIATLRETPRANNLIKGFVRHVFGG